LLFRTKKYYCCSSRFSTRPHQHTSTTLRGCLSYGGRNKVQNGLLGKWPPYNKIVEKGGTVEKRGGKKGPSLLGQIVLFPYYYYYYYYYYYLLLLYYILLYYTILISTITITITIFTIIYYYYFYELLLLLYYYYRL
jgi:hypothetical protein